MQPVSGDQYIRISAAGTTVRADRPVVLKRVIIPGTYVGSVEFYDSATAAGTAATNLITNVVLPGLNQNYSFDVNAQAKTGLVTVATGTPTISFTYN